MADAPEHLSRNRGARESWGFTQAAELRECRRIWRGPFWSSRVYTWEARSLNSVSTSAYTVIQTDCRWGRVLGRLDDVFRVVGQVHPE